MTYFFELSILRKYLIPRKKQLSVSLIALMSVTVISLVVWLILLFLSITEGMENKWLDKLTSFNAPIKITPTSQYFSSYYYLIDHFAAESNYTTKTIGEKLGAEKIDPYSPQVDWELPSHLPKADLDPSGHLKDPVKLAYGILSGKKDVTYQDYEVTGALMRLDLLRPRTGSITQINDTDQRSITQASYIASFAQNSPYLTSLLTTPTISDLNHLFYLANVSTSFQEELSHLLPYVTIDELKPSQDYWRLPFSFISKSDSLVALAHLRDGNLLHLLIPTTTKKLDRKDATLGILKIKDGKWCFQTASQTFAISEETPLLVTKDLTIKATLKNESCATAQNLCDLLFQSTISVQGKTLHGDLSWDGLEISKASVQTHFDKSPDLLPPWIYSVVDKFYLPPQIENSFPLLLPQNFQDTGIRLGDKGHFSFGAMTGSSVQELRLPFYIAGFYDSGILAIGNRSALAPVDLVRTINSASRFANIDEMSANGIQVWFSNLKDTDTIKNDLQASFQKAGIDPYWKITTFKEYDFAKDLLEQFQSDKYLFAIIGIIILLVGCSNIISLLVLLVNDKKKEIGVMQSMGASSLSIAAIFGGCGAFLGIISTLIGTIAALLTLHNIDAIVNCLSFIQGHEAFNAAFYGKSLPSELSPSAVRFILVVTPLISLLAGLIPAIKACRFKPSAILRGES